jgi:large subunit ribosomal protein L14
MVFTETIIKTLDNSGASFVKCVRVLNNSRVRPGKVGDTLILSIREIIPRIVYNRKKHLRKKKMVQKGEVHRGILLCSGAAVKRGNG